MHGSPWSSATSADRRAVHAPPSSRADASHVPLPGTARRSCDASATRSRPRTGRCRVPARTASPIGARRCASASVGPSSGVVTLLQVVAVRSSRIARTVSACGYRVRARTPGLPAGTISTSHGGATARRLPGPRTWRRPAGIRRAATARRRVGAAIAEQSATTREIEAALREGQVSSSTEVPLAERSVRGGRRADEADHEHRGEGERDGGGRLLGTSDVPVVPELLATAAPESGATLVVAGGWTCRSAASPVEARLTSARRTRTLGQSSRRARRSGRAARYVPGVEPSRLVTSSTVLVDSRRKRT